MKRWQRWAVTHYADGDTHETLVGEHRWRWWAERSKEMANYPFALTMIVYTNHLVQDGWEIVGFEVEIRDVLESEQAPG